MNIQDLIQLMSMVSRSSNPQYLLMNIANQDPNMRRAMEMANGKDDDQLRQTVLNLASQRGISPEQLNQMLFNFGIRL